MRPHRAFRAPFIALFAALFLASSSACSHGDALDPVVGTWLATTFQVSPFGQGPTNVLTSGGTLGFNVATNFVTTGTLIIPAALAGGTTFTASMAGTAVRTGNTVRFTQSADTFMRDLTFTLNENRLEALNQTVSGTRYDVILTRQ